jgi:transcriptional regulator with XRE-family HTH domain
MGSQQASSIDAYVGGRIRERRVSLGLSARELAKIIGLTTPAVLKYETGGNRILVRRLYEIAQALNSPIEYFFEGLDAGPLRVPRRQRRLLELMRYFPEIEEKHQALIRDIVRLLADR